MRLIHSQNGVAGRTCESTRCPSKELSVTSYLALESLSKLLRRSNPLLAPGLNSMSMVYHTAIQFNTRTNGSTHHLPQIEQEKTTARCSLTLCTAHGTTRPRPKLSLAGKPFDFTPIGDPIYRAEHCRSTGGQSYLRSTDADTLPVPDVPAPRYAPDGHDLVATSGLWRVLSFDLRHIPMVYMSACTGGIIPRRCSNSIQVFDGYIWTSCIYD